MVEKIIQPFTIVAMKTGTRLNMVVHASTTPRTFLTFPKQHKKLDEN